MKDGDTASRIEIDELFNPAFAQLTVVINTKEVIKYVFINKNTKGFTIGLSFMGLMFTEIIMQKKKKTVDINERKIVFKECKLFSSMHTF